MNIRPSAAIRQNYNEIADLCRKTAEPIFLTKNGEGDLVVMDIETYNRREKMLKLREELLAVQEDRLAGRAGCTLDELDDYLDDKSRWLIYYCRSFKYSSASSGAISHLGIPFVFTACCISRCRNQQISSSFADPCR